MFIILVFFKAGIGQITIAECMYLKILVYFLPLNFISFLCCFKPWIITYAYCFLRRICQCTWLTTRRLYYDLPRQSKSQLCMLNQFTALDML